MDPIPFYSHPPAWTPSPEPLSALRIACQNGDITAVRALLEDENIDVNSRDLEGDRPVRIANQHHQFEIVDLLIKDERVEIDGGSELFRRAVIYGSIEVVQTLLQHPKLDLDQERHLYDALISMHQGYLQIASLLISDLRINVNSSDEDGLRFAIHFCIEHNHDDLLKSLLLRADLEINQTGIIGEDDEGDDIMGSPFADACRIRSPLMIKILLQDSRTDVNGSVLGQPHNFNAVCTCIHEIDAMKLYLDKWDMHITVEQFRDALKITSEEILKVILAKSVVSEPLRNLIAEAWQEHLEEFPATHQAWFQKYGDQGPSQLIRNLWVEYYADCRPRDLFAMIVLHSDGILAIYENKKTSNAGRFFKIANALPQEIQMVLANRMAGSSKDIIGGDDRESGLRTIVKLVSA